MPEFLMIPANQMQVPNAYQRDTDEARAHRMAADYDESLLGVLEVVAPNDSSSMYAIMDGGHRWAATVIARGEHTLLPCMVHHLTVEDQAAYFVRVNSQRKAPKPIEVHRANLAAGETLALEIERIVSSVGFKIGQTGMRSVVTLRSIVERLGYEALEQSLAVCRDAWGLDQIPKNNCIMAIARIVNRYESIDMQRLASAVGSLTYQQWEILSREDRLSNGRDGMTGAIAQRMIQTYNKGLRGGARLPLTKRIRAVAR